MSQTKEQVALSKFMSFALRHKPEDVGLILTAEGKAVIDDLVHCHNVFRKTRITASDVLAIVASCDKQRYSVSEDQTLIWANQGHSADVDVQLTKTAPPTRLYHGTADRYYASIILTGLKSASRQHVHLSADQDTARNVGMRHGRPVVLGIDAKRMHEDGIEFYLSANGVWLCEYVDPKYIIKPIRENA